MFEEVVVAYFSNILETPEMDPIKSQSGETVS
jgi:hypothetical protein